MVREKGFSLVELLIVVAIILIIAAIAIPNLMRSRIAANEAAAVSGIRAITTAEHAYNQTYPQIGFTCTISELGPPPNPTDPPTETAAGILDPVIAAGAKSGYSYALANCVGTPRASFESAATPLQIGSSGQRSFCSDSSGVIRYSEDGLAASCKAGNKILQ
ncbi:MAG TPA: prepilin-type N-terminal cleavage/methylation domain-containing protein [Terriglobales bacterium]|nr:prepilin-type N-terminal cleavage/methylation domain-containing protein [Terriglobales bacterium]